MDDCCDICGDIGVVDAIITCHKCKVAREHLYCMRVYCEESPKYWCCETCELGKEANLPTSVTRQDLTFKTSDKVHNDPKQSADPGKSEKHLRKCFVDWEKKVQTGRTRYIPVQEALKLPSGSKTSGLAVKNNTWLQSGPVLPKTTSVKTPAKPRTPPPKFSLQQNEEKHSGKSSVQALSMKKHINRAQSGNVLKHIAEGKTTQTRVERAIASQAPLTSSGCPPSIISGKGSNICTTLELRTSNAEKVSLKNSRPNVDSFYCDPAMDASWKGSFKILNNLKHEGPCDGIQAHPPSRVRKKVYDLSKLMPEVLQFELIPRGNLFTNKDCCPGKDDIGLFFFPGKSGRCENYSSLLELIGTEDLVMRMCIFGVELLVLTSTLLRTDCQRWNGEYFFWGLFHRVEKHKTGLDVHNILLACPPNEVPNYTVEGDNKEVVDMEIDADGEHVGSVYTPPITREPFRKGSDIDTTVCGGFPLSDVKKEPCIDIPPGFEKMCKQGVNDSPASFKSIRFSNEGEVETPGRGICSKTDKRLLATSKSKDFQSQMHARSASMPSSWRHDDRYPHPSHVKVKSEIQ